jgi:uncharacterized protein (DUF433 family)
METQPHAGRGSQPAANSHVEATPKICGGKPRVRGTRIRVQDVAMWHERLGLSADEIVSRFPQLTLAAVYGALAYYHDHRDEIQLELRSADDLVDQLRIRYPSRMRDKLPPAA